MKRLVIDCATQVLSLALLDKDGLSAHRHQHLGRGHAEALVPMIHEMLGGARADAIAVNVGPGSFTGIRVGIAAARALGFAWNVPVAGYDCLSLIAAMAQRDGAPGDSPVDSLAVVMIGGHGELFWQRFDGRTLEPLTPLGSTPVAELAALLTDERVHGSAARTLVDARGWGEAVETYPDAAAWPLLPDGARTLPPSAIYGREADARPMAARAAGASQ